jgi:hypothetical protein
VVFPKCGFFANRQCVRRAKQSATNCVEMWRVMLLLTLALAPQPSLSFSPVAAPFAVSRGPSVCTVPRAPHPLPRGATGAVSVHMQLCNYLWQRVHPVLACVVAWALRVLVIVCPLQFTSDVAPADGRRGQGLHINRRRAHQRQKEVRAPARTIVRGCRPLRETPATCMHIWCPPFVLATDRCAICSARHIDEIVHSTCMCVVACACVQGAHHSYRCRYGRKFIPGVQAKDTGGCLCMCFIFSESEVSSFCLVSFLYLPPCRLFNKQSHICRWRATS